MKKILLSLLSICLCSAVVSAQVIVNKNITTNTTWTANNIYQIEGGFIYVTDNATLTIEPGTIIKGNASALVITRGAKIIAKGTLSKPIVFTSYKEKGKRNAGDWAGLVLLGKAPINPAGGEALLEGGVDATLGKFGGTDANDNSGVLSYVRIEFAGIAFQPDKEINSLTLGGVGRGTQIDHVQCSYGGDDAFEWFGGTVDTKYLVAFKTVDDMFDTDFGFSGRNQFLLGISDPLIADISGSNGFESDNDGQGTTATPFTDAKFSNVTIVGPKAYLATGYNNNFKRGAHIRRASKQDITNTVITGFPTLYRPENNSVDYFLNDEAIFKNIVFDENKLIDSSKNTTLAPKYAQVETKVKADNTISTFAAINFTDINAFNFLPKAGSPLLSGANFTGLDSYFTPTTYRGAFGTENWTAGWCNFDPQNADYSKPLATNEISTLTTIKAYPNPTADDIIIEANFNTNTTVQINVLNLAGQIVLAQKTTFTEGNSSLKLATNMLQTGMYFIQLSDNTGVNTLKMFKK